MTRNARWMTLALGTLVVVGTGMNCLPPELQDELMALNCPNPSATEFEVTVVSKSGSSGTIRLTGTVRNIGLQTFDSSAGQQSVWILSSGILVAQQDFEDLAPAEEVTITYETTWSRSTEFPPTFTLMLSYDPDIFIDGNENNDDCRTTDNELELTPTEINAVFDAA